MNPANLLSAFFSDVAISVIRDEAVETNLYRRAAYASGWSASKLEYAARSLRRQEKALHAVADGKTVVTRNSRFSRRDRNRQELLAVIRDCWTE